MEIKNRYTGEVVAIGDTAKETAQRNIGDLRRADLCGANLRRADLYGANLREADLYGAKYGEELLLKYFTVGPIGSRADYLQVFITDKQTVLKTGCFSGTLEELATRTDRYDCKAVIPFIQAMVELERING